MLLGLLFLVVIFLAYANGANDNFKGVATLLGSRTAGYRGALFWATGTTFAGSLAAIALSGLLMESFTGKGLVPDVLVGEPAFVVAVATGAALTVMMATFTGLPISTTHALTGALVGAGVAAMGSVHLGQLSSKFFVPLLVSPFISFTLTASVYPLWRRLRLRIGIKRDMCLCVANTPPEPVAVLPEGNAVLRSSGSILTVGQLEYCQQRYEGTMWGIDAQTVLDKMHYLSAGAVSFARGLNDTPKMVALLVAGKLSGLSLPAALFVVGAGIAIGGLVNARKVAVTMSEKITGMNHGQGFAANLTTAFLVLIASRFGLPVSTTHVSCGSLFGMGAVTGQGNSKMIRGIILAWVLTLPVAAGFAALSYFVISLG